MTEIALPPPMFSDSLVDCEPVMKPDCQQARVDAVHVTGDEDNFYVLTEYEQRELMLEIERVDALAKAFQQIVQDTPDQPPPCVAGFGSATVETCGCPACQKELWAREAERAGLFSLHQAQVQAEEVRLSREEDIQGRASELKKRREEFGPMCGWFSGETSCTIGKKVIEALDAEIKALKQRLKAEPRQSAMIATDTVPNKALASRAYTRRRDDKGVVEVIVLSRPDRRYYISRAAADRMGRRSMRVEVGRKPEPGKLDSAGLKARAGELVKSLRQQVGQRIREDLAKPLGNLEARLKTWEFLQDSAINTLHQEFSGSSDRSDDARYAVSGEAHLMRFAAQASAGFSGFDPEKGMVSLGIKGQASFALAEGRVAFEAFLPRQGGYDCFIAYKNAAQQRVYHRFGAFRLRAAIELSCFVGGVAAGSATAGARWKPAPSGASALLTSPELDSRGGKVQLKGSLFAGAQFGGALTGGLEWMAPAIQHRENARWAPLLEVRTEGNVAFGGGATLDFQIMLTDNRLYFHAKGHLVFGSGGGGGFGTLVDLEKVGELVAVVYQALSEVDFRQLFCIDEGAFKLFYRAVSWMLSEPGKTLNELVGQGIQTVEDWWKGRLKNIASVGRLVDRILNDEPLTLGTQRIPLCRLPPEVLGPALYMLSEYYLLSPRSNTEKAIIHLLRQVSSWRQFYLVLERMHPTAAVVSAADSVQRIRLYLSAEQQKQFSNFIKHLGERADDAQPGQPLPKWQPWQPLYVNDKFDELMAARDYWEANRYV